jgi:hypothetical protein
MAAETKTWKTITQDDEREVSRLLSELYVGFNHRPMRLTKDCLAPAPVMNAREYFKRNVNTASNWRNGFTISNEHTFFDSLNSYYDKMWPRIKKPMLELGCVGTFKESTDVVFWMARPEIKVDEAGNAHCDDGPAVTYDLGEVHYVHGVAVPGFVITSPHSITVKCIESEDNNEVRRVMIERWPGGWDSYLRSVGELIDQRRNDRDAQTEMLFKDPKSSMMRKFLVADPSTGRRYALNVPWSVKTCEEAQRWLSHGLDTRAIHRS